MLEEYRTTAFHAACANTASISALDDIKKYPKDSPEFKVAVVTMRQSNHTHSALEEAARVRVSHIRHTKDGGKSSDSDNTGCLGVLRLASCHTPGFVAYADLRSLLYGIIRLPIAKSLYW
jgi:hypothetical protein